MKMNELKSLDLENLKITIKDITGQEYAFPERKVLEALRKNGVLSLLEYTDKVELEIGCLKILVERK